MRIGMFTDYYLPVKTGVSTSVASFREQLEKLGHEVYVFAPSAGILVREEDDHIIRFPAIKGLFVENYMTSVFFPPQQIRKIEKLNLDIIHFHTPSQIGLLGVHVALKNDIPLVGTYHTDLHEYVKTYPVIGSGFLFLSLAAPIITGGGFKDVKITMPSRNRQSMNEAAVKHSMTLIHNYCALVIAPSKKMELQLKRWKTTAPIEILPTGVDKITTTKAEVAARKEQYGISDDDQVVMFTGRLGKEKNVELLIKAFAKARKSMLNLKLMLVGDFKHSDSLLDLAGELGISDWIIKTGYIENDQLGALFGCADLFVLPSLSDTQCLVLNEAAHAGLPLIAVDGLINDVVQDGVNGYITKPTVTAVATAITIILSDPNKIKAMGTASVEQAKKFSETAQARKLAALYNDILHTKREH
jgi:glycosyltransferase involved in cell wall biosynthesis